jgi:hypothetical protein
MTMSEQLFQGPKCQIADTLAAGGLGGILAAKDLQCASLGSYEAPA